MKPNIAGWVGHVITFLVSAFLLMDAALKVLGAKVAVDATAVLGFGPEEVRVLGWILLASTLLYAYPTSAALGAVLLTGYLGGAIAVQAQHHSPLFSHVLFGFYVGAFAWAGLLLRSPALRSLVSTTAKGSVSNRNSNEG